MCIYKPLHIYLYISICVVGEANTRSILVLYLRCTFETLMQLTVGTGKYINLLKGGADFYLAVLKQIMEL